MKHSFRFATFISAGTLLFALPVLADSPGPARPGTINYVEGQVVAGSETLGSQSIGKVELSPGETISTSAGKAEVLLTPGVFVRLGDQSSARMISTGLTNTQMSLDTGEAIVEVVEIHPENMLGIVEDGRETQLLKTGLYDFNENLHVVRVLDGEAVIHEGRKDLKIKAGHMVDLTATDKLKTTKYDKQEVEAENLYHWTSLRSSYLAEANADYAPTYANAGAGWYGDGWYWDPWFDAYTFMPWDGIFFSPFGWGFYSPWCAFGAPLWGFGGYSGYGYGGYGYHPVHYPHRFGPDPGHWGPGEHYGNPTNYGHGVHYASRSEGGVAIGSRGFFGGRSGGFHGGMGGFHGGASGFHGSTGGGFHGGGFGGGGFHGGGGFGGGGFGGGGGHR